jgi:GT2 family glycosyltransferase
VIALVILTHNRLELLRRCMENVVARTSSLTEEIVVWNNGSQDGTQSYLDSLTDRRLQVIHHPTNLAMNALRRAIRHTRAPYLIELDDDIVEAPPGWDETLLDAYLRLGQFGFLAASIAYDPSDSASRYLRFMRDVAGAYTPTEINGIRVLEGSVGGACTMTSRELYLRVGGFREHKRYAYWRPEIPYQRAIRKLGYRTGFLLDLEVRHAGGQSKWPREKDDWHRYEAKVRARRNAVKRAILRIPPLAALNERYRWFDPPLPPYEPARYAAESQQEAR